MIRRWSWFAILGCAGIALTSGAVRSADELQGAGAALKALNDRQKPAVPDPNSPNPLSRLRSAIQKLEKEAPTLPPAEAAHRWVELLQQYENLDYNQAFG